jgi:hypothetical protein
LQQMLCAVGQLVLVHAPHAHTRTAELVQQSSCIIAQVAHSMNHCYAPQQALLQRSCRLRAALLHGHTLNHHASTPDAEASRCMTSSGDMLQGVS